MSDLIKTIAARIRRIREEQGFTQITMADQLAITPGAYAKIKRGEVDFQISRLYQLAEIFDLDILNLLKEEDEIFNAAESITKKEYDKVASDLKKFELRLESFAGKTSPARKKAKK